MFFCNRISKHIYTVNSMAAELVLLLGLIQENSFKF